MLLVDHDGTDVLMTLTARVAGALPDPLLRRAIHRFWKYQEPELRRLGDYLHPDRAAVDVGTWWGPWTAAFARQCPAVHAIEPQPQLAERLRSWAPANVTVHETAIGDSVGRAMLGRPDATPGNDGLASLRDGATAADSVEVAVTTIDALGLENVGLMKIDVEGFELPALRGAEATIERDRPRLMIEIEQRHLDVPIDVVFGWLADHGYEGHLLRNGEWEPLASFDVDRDQLASVDRPRRAAYLNAFLFTPVEESWSAPR